jgi:predicted GNAT family acetyltransferase
MKTVVGDKLKGQGLDFGYVKQVLQDVAPQARNADIFIIHPGPWIYTVKTLHQDLRTIMTPGCVAYVLTDNEDDSHQADLLVDGLTRLGGFTMTVQKLVPDVRGMVNLMAGTQDAPLMLKPYQFGGYKLIRIVRVS